MKMLNQILKSGSLARKMTINLSIILLLALASSMILLYTLLNNQANKQIDLRSTLIMDTMVAVRDYTNEHVNPIIAPINKQSELSFHPESIPTYSANTVFSYLNKISPEYATYTFRHATLNPTNLKDKADSEEAKIINKFRGNSELKQLSGERTSPTGKFYYIAKPLVVTKASCLQCHSEPSKAPASLLATYGHTNGFGWNFGETVGALIVNIPIELIHKYKWEALISTTLLTALSLISMAFATIVIFQRDFLRPILQISQRANQASINPESVEFGEISRKDEIGTIARSFDRMKKSLNISMKMLHSKLP
jgi:hypothetical protein